MPLARIGSKLVYFAHVPKCAGTAVERYMEKRFGPLGMLYSRYGKIPEQERWSVTSPQHMPESTRQQYLPDSFIDASFSIIRHPAIRLRSVFLFQREIEHRISAETSFPAWLDTIETSLETDPTIYDRHLRPMAESVPETAVVFKLERGLNPLGQWFDSLSETTDGPREIQAFNVLSVRMSRENAVVPRIELSDSDLTKVSNIYAVDYERFNYNLQPEITKAITT